MFGDLTTPKKYYSKLERSLFQSCTVEVKAVSMRSVIVNSHHPNPVPLERMPTTSRACYYCHVPIP